MTHWHLLDGTNLAFRCFYGVSDLARDDGFPTNAIYGWLRMLWKLQDMESGRWVVFFDISKSDKRQALLETYKANRPPTPEAFKQQMPYLRELSGYMGLQVIERVGVEADDMIAALSRQLSGHGERVTIVSSDKDFGQCLGGNVDQLVPPPTANPALGWRRFDEATFREKYGVEARQTVDYLSLVGDASDNVPGIAGVGPKTAAKWLSEWGSLEGIFSHIDALNPERFRALLKEQRALLDTNRQLITFEAISPADLPELQEFSPQPNELLRVLEELKMDSLIKAAKGRYPQDKPAESEQLELF
ncbi:MAG TPA: 5'-3' exonuclease [Opitutae bacterium]|nr:5'-3' exonuclease [Opitutae bacterium]